MKTKVFIAGDSHAGVLAKAALNAEILGGGGPIAAGRFLEKSFFSVQDNKLVLNLSPDLAPKLREKRQSVFEDILDFNGPILCTVGFNSVRFATRFAKYCDDLLVNHNHISDQLFRQCVVDSRSGSLDFYRALVEHGKNVFFTCSPQITPPSKFGLVTRFDNVLIEKIQEIGSVFIDVRSDILDGKFVKSEYVGLSNHGNQRWAKLVINKMFDIYYAADSCTNPC